MTSKEAIKTIKNIELHHIECEMDDYCDDGSIYMFEERDGSIEENYPDEIKAIEKDLEVLELIKEKAVNVARLNYAIRTEKGLESYNSFAIIEGFDELTRKEYKLLKGWLL